MDTLIARRMHADPRVVFDLAADVEAWPRLLPHYRWVRPRQHTPDGRPIFEMAARRQIAPGVAWPLWWLAALRLDRPNLRIVFDHVGGITRGMHVEWQLTPAPPDSVQVQIRHVFCPRWPVPDRLVELIVGDYFVNGVARRTLHVIDERAHA